MSVCLAPLSVSLQPLPSVPPKLRGTDLCPGASGAPILTHGVAALLHGTNATPSFHAAAQSPALLQVLKVKGYRLRGGK